MSSELLHPLIEGVVSLASGLSVCLYGYGMHAGDLDTCPHVYHCCCSANIPTNAEVTTARAHREPVLARDHLTTHEEPC